MSKDVTKFFTKAIEQISLMSKDRGGGILNAGMLGEGSSAKVIIEPVKTTFSNKEEITVAWDISLEALLLQVEDYERIAYFNGRDTSVLFDDYQTVVDEAAEGNASDSDFYPLVKDLPLSIMVDVQPDGKANVKITGKKRVESLDGNVFTFTNQEILNMVEDYQITFNVDSATTVNITLAGSNGTIDWGDGNVENLTVAEKTYSHTYSAAGSFTITQAHELTKLQCNTPQVSGDIASVSGLTNLTVLYLAGTQVSGDISSVSGLTNLTNLQLYHTQVSGDIASVSELTNLTVLHLGSTQVSGDIASVSGLTNLTVLYLYSTQVSGDIASVSGLTNLTYLNLYNTQVSGDISSISGLTNLMSLQLYHTQVSGDIASVSELTNLTYLYLGNTQVSGDISSVSGLTNLTSLYLYSTQVSGDIANVSGLTNLIKLYLYNSQVSDYTSTDLPAWSGCNIDLKDLGLSDAEVSDFIVDLDNAGGTGGTLDISGNNGCVDQGSDADNAITNLVDNKDWTVTYNEC